LYVNENYFVTYLVPYEHAQNELAKAFIKNIQLVARPLFLHAQLFFILWGHVVLHAGALLHLRPILLNVQTPYELLLDHPMFHTSEYSDVRYGCTFKNPNATQFDPIGMKDFI
jgi:hypothetical protein